MSLRKRRSRPERAGEGEEKERRLTEGKLLAGFSFATMLFNSKILGSTTLRIQTVINSYYH